MSDYIKRSKAIDIYKPYTDRGLKVPVENIISNLEDLPSADVVERKRGEWIYSPVIHTLKFEGETAELEEKRWKCSECGYTEELDSPPNFCGYCGASMVADRKE